ncbi:hypothetical protein ABT237_15655 [Streptomyces sp. NPDC001581]|uniref:hypothetical protein n=1 Tax=Streptomyces sp. NPDC001581 TaxID=3154386 RepID=UPI0033306B36
MGQQMRPLTKWLIALGGLTVVLPMVALAGYVLHVLDGAGKTEAKPAACAKAMKAMGWTLPAGADGQACVEKSDIVFESQWSGTFRMPRSEVRGWLDSHPEERFPSQRDPRGVFEVRNGLHLNLGYPKAPNFGNGGIDAVEVDVTWDGEAAAVVTFETHPD